MNLKKVGLRIKFLRLKNLQITQEDFATFIGFDRTYMSKIKSGKQNITLETFFKIYEGLKISPSNFFLDGEAMKENNYE